MSNFSIQIATTADIPGMISVRHDTWLTTYPNSELGITVTDLELKLQKMHEGEAERWVNRIENDVSCRSWVAKEGEKIIGFISVQKLPEENKIWSLYVRGEYQRSGIGDRLINCALEWLDKNKKTILEVASYNDQAISFYKKYGFQEKGLIDDPFGKLPSGKIIPEVVMVRDPVI